MIFEVIVDSRNITRVTIAKERTTVKIAEKYSEDTRKQIVAFARSIEEDMRKEYNITIRGTFTDDLADVLFYNDKRTKQFVRPTGITQ